MHFSLDTIASALADAGLLVERRGTVPPNADGISEDSRAVHPGSVFIAVRGSERDGHDYLAAARGAGAIAAIVEDPERCPPDLLPSLVVSDGRRAAPIA